jgi:carbonic anhydrase/acetyltransferase-like protein (isoleucine patch superfamily)
MATILPVLDKFPQFGTDCFIAPNATVAGNVVMGNYCSVWFNAVVRGDVNYIKIGNKVNIQDGVISHCTYHKHPVTIGNNVSIGHGAIVHGCFIHDDVLIGMGAIVMDGCEIQKNSIVAAGAVVIEGTIVEEGSLYAGVPAKKIKKITKELLHNEIERIANNYITYSSWFADCNALSK